MELSTLLFIGAGAFIAYSLLSNSANTAQVEGSFTTLLNKVKAWVNSSKTEIPLLNKSVVEDSIIPLVKDWENLRNEASARNMPELRATLDDAFKLLNTHTNKEVNNGQ